MLSEKLKKYRTDNNLTQEEFAAKLFVTRNAVSKWENDNGIPSDINLEGICKYFDIDEESLLDKNDLKEVIKNIEFSKRNIVFLSFVLIFCMTLFCFFIGGSYHFHRVGIAFTFTYFIFKLFVPKNMITKFLSI